MTEVLAHLSLGEEVGVQRVGEIVIAGIAVPPASVSADSPFAVRAADGLQSPVQLLDARAGLPSQPLIVSVAFPASCAAAAEQAPLALIAAPHGVDATAPSLAVDVRDAEVRVRNGEGRAPISFGPGTCLVRPGDLMPGGIGSTIVLDDVTCHAVVDDIAVVHPGPLLAELELRGRYVAEDGDERRAGLTCRARVRAGRQAVELAVSLILDTSALESRLTSWRIGLSAPVDRATLGAFEHAESGVPPLEFGHPGGGHPRGIFVTSAVSGGTDWKESSEPGYLDRWEWAELHGPVAQNWAVLHEDAGGVRTVAVERMCEHHPSRVRIASDRTDIELFDGSDGPAVLAQGSAPRRRITVTAGADRRAGAILDHPLVAFQPDLLRQLRPDVLPFLPGELPNLESLIRAELFGWYLFGQSLGFYDHGDGMQAIPAGPRMGYSSNNEHDALYALLLHYLRSGERAYLDSAIAYGDHTVDIDLIHHSEYRHEIGGLRAHGRSHVHYVDARTPSGPVRTSIDTGHMWVEGLVLLSAVTGETRYLDAALRVGRCLLHLERLGWTRPEPGPRNAGWPLVALSSLAAATGESSFLDAAQRIATSAIQRQQHDGRWLMRLGYFDDYCAWQNAVLLTGLSRLHALDPAPDLRLAIERGGRALLERGRTPEGTFVYLGRYDYRWTHRTGLVREVLACLYELTGDSEYLHAGLLGGGRWYPPSGRPRVTSEEIAEWRGHLPFLGHAHRAGLLEDLP